MTRLVKYDAGEQDVFNFSIARDKAILLELSHRLSLCRSLLELGTAIRQILKPELAVVDYIVAVTDLSGETLSYLTHDLDDRFAGNAGFHLFLAEKKAVQSLDARLYREKTQIVRWQTSDMSSEELYPNAAFWNACQTNSIAAVPLWHDGRSYGLLCMRDGQLEDESLIALSVTVAIAIAWQRAAEEMDRIRLAIDQYKLRIEEEKIYLREELDTLKNYAGIVGDSTEMQTVYRLVSRVAPAESTVLLLGETGTGKELVARAIHNASPRSGNLMVKVNCAALPANLIESELFGHERGSFTGAYERRIGKFELANNGTIFLDEIGEMPLELQVKLLRALQEREIERVGGKTTIKINVRVIAATNRDLEREIEEGRFRSDLFYRLNIFPIELPALRNRRDDIPLLVKHFLTIFSKKTGKKVTSISRSAMQDLKTYGWPGNIRELEHVIERSVLLASGDTITQIPLPVQKNRQFIDKESTPLMTLEENERRHILAVLAYCKGRVSGRGSAAEILDMPATTLGSRMKKLGISRKYTD